MTPLADSVAALFKVYGPKIGQPWKPDALSKALEGLVTSHVEARDARTAKDWAASTCRKLHEGTSDDVVCAACFEAALEKINGQF